MRYEKQRENMQHEKHQNHETHGKSYVLSDLWQLNPILSFSQQLSVLSKVLRDFVLKKASLRLKIWKISNFFSFQSLKLKIIGVWDLILIRSFPGAFCYLMIFVSPYLICIWYVFEYCLRKNEISEKMWWKSHIQQAFLRVKLSGMLFVSIYRLGI